MKMDWGTWYGIKDRCIDLLWICRKMVYWIFDPWVKPEDKYD